MLNVGLTGGIACGKSTVAKMFVQKGAYLIDFDLLAHKVQEPENAAWKKIVDCFGREILQANGKIDRIKLGRIVFADKKKLHVLNKIVHPLVYQEWHRQLEKIGEKDPHAIVLSDIPLLFEGRKQHLFDVILLVLIDPEDQIHRLTARNRICREEAERRLKSQMPIGEKAILADIVIDNRRSLPETQKMVNNVWKELLQREKEKRDDSLKPVT